MLLHLRQFEVKGVSLERTAEYRILESEDGGSISHNNFEGRIVQEISSSQALEGWPIKGSLSVSNLAARYSQDLPDILHNVSFDVEGGQRVGIVGATGGGKSTLAKAFFSFVDITNGKIEIDGKGDVIHLATLLIDRHRSYPSWRCPLQAWYHCAGPYPSQRIIAAQP